MTTALHLFSSRVFLCHCNRYIHSWLFRSMLFVVCFLWQTAHKSNNYNLDKWIVYSRVLTFKSFFVAREFLCRFNNALYSRFYCTFEEQNSAFDRAICLIIKHMMALLLGISNRGFFSDFINEKLNTNYGNSKIKQTCSMYIFF